MDASREMTIHRLFQLGMKRELPELLPFPEEGAIVNLGAGRAKITGAVNLDWPEWDAERYEIALPSRIPAGGLRRAEDGEVAGVHAYHFLEHLVDPRRMLREMGRVLRVGGVANLVVPHPFGTLAFQDLDHKHFFTLDTWRNTFTNPFYDKGNNSGYPFRVHFNILLAVVERNVAMLTQLVRV